MINAHHLYSGTRCVRPCAVVVLLLLSVVPPPAVQATNPWLSRHLALTPSFPNEKGRNHHDSSRRQLQRQQTTQFVLQASNYAAVYPSPEFLTPDVSFSAPISAYMALGRSSSSLPQQPSASLPLEQLLGSYRVCTAPGSCFLVPKLAKGNSSSSSWKAPPPTFSVREEDVKSHNTILGTINIDPKYTMPVKGSTSAKPEHYLIEGARRMLAAGSTVYKFQLRPQVDDMRRLDWAYRGFLRIVQNSQLPYQQLLDMPFRTFIMWAGLLPGPGKPYEYSDVFGLDVYKETYELTKWLLTRYNNTGKTFMIGIWEGDWELRNDYNRTGMPQAARIADMLGLLAAKQQAVDDAKADCPHSDVFVWNYAEANLIYEGMVIPGMPTIANKVAPTVRPVLDYISVSISGNIAIRELDPTARLHPLLDHVEQHLPRKAAVPGTRVFIGEFGFPLAAVNGVQQMSPDEQAQRALWVAASSIAWGAPIVLWWQLYDNELLNITGTLIYRGFWLVDFNAVEQPLLIAMRKYFAAAQDFVRAVAVYTGCLPTSYQFRRWAVAQLVQLSGLPDVLAPPGPVRDRSSADEVAPGVQGSFVRTKCAWACSSADCPPVPDNEAQQPASEGAPWKLDPAFYDSILDVNKPPALAPESVSTAAFTPKLTTVIIPAVPGTGQPATSITINPALTPLDSLVPASSPARVVTQTITLPPPRPPFVINQATPVNAATNPEVAMVPTAVAPTSSPAAVAAVFPASAATPEAAVNNQSVTFPSSSTASLPSTAPSSNANATSTALMSPKGAVSARPLPAWMTQPARASITTCGSAAELRDKIVTDPACPFFYAKITADVQAYTFGGVDRIGCINCQQPGLWPQFCMWRKTNSKFYDAINYNQREGYGRLSVQKSISFVVNLTRSWPGSGGIPTAGNSNSSSITPGPAEITPCDVWRLIRGRTLWIIGDSEMKGLFLALKCFMLEFWDLKHYRVSWNESVNSYLSSLPYDAEGACVHMPDSTRICQLKVLWADVAVMDPDPDDKRYSEPVLRLMQKRLAAPEDIFAINFGLWYSKDPVGMKTRYREHLTRLGEFYKATAATWPNVFFLETIRLHWPAGFEQDVSSQGHLEECAPTRGVGFNFSDGSLAFTMPAQLSAQQQANVAAFLAYEAANSTGQRRLSPSAGFLQQQQRFVADANLTQPEAPATAKQQAALASAASDAAALAGAAAVAAHRLGHGPAVDAAADRARAAAATAAGFAALLRQSQHHQPWRHGTAAGRISQQEQEVQLLQLLLSQLQRLQQGGAALSGSDASPSPAATAAAAVKRGEDVRPTFRHAAGEHATAAAAKRQAALASTAATGAFCQVMQLQDQLQKPTHLHKAWSVALGWTKLRCCLLQHSVAATIGWRSFRRQQPLAEHLLVARRHLARAAAASGSRSAGFKADGRTSGAPSSAASAFAASAAAYAAATDAWAAAAAAQAAEAASSGNDTAVAAASAASSSAQSAAAAAALAKEQAARSMAVAAGKPVDISSVVLPAMSIWGTPVTGPSTAMAATASSNTSTGPPVLDEAEAAAVALLGGWQNVIARQVLRDTFKMPWVPIYNASVPPYWAHRNPPETPDCIHPCNPGTPQTWIAQLMLAISLKVKPLDTITDKRCLWGNTVVQLEAEGSLN